MADDPVAQINSRHYKRMVEAIDLYETGDLTLRGVIDRLSGLIASIEGISLELKNEFLARWGVLEDIYATSLYRRGNAELDAQEHETITCALGEIRDAASRRIVSSKE